MLSVHRSLSISYAPKEANCVAHVLAKHALKINSGETWMEVAPSWLVPFLRVDLEYCNLSSS